MSAATAPGGAAVRAALDRLVARWQAAIPPAWTAFDPDWRSCCELGAPDAHGRIRWQPVSRAGQPDHPALDGLARAIGAPLHPDLVAYWSAWWGAGFEAGSREGHVSLLQLWNDDDAERLVENQVGHVLTARRRNRRAPLTLFFACTEPDSDLVLVLDNATGAVLLEQPGVGIRRTVEADLATFLDRLVPVPAPPADPG